MSPPQTACNMRLWRILEQARRNRLAMVELNSAEDLDDRLQQIGVERYHHLHHFHKLLHGGKLNRGQVQAWALNRFYYQRSIPIKDAALMSRMDDRDMRREWRHRLEDHDGVDGGEGGIDRWLKLTDALGLDREFVCSCAGVLPITRFAVDAYVRFVRERPLLEGVAASLTELYAPGIHRERIAGLLEHYAFADDATTSYFQRRLTQAPRDADYALTYVKRAASTPEQRRAVCEAVIFKCNTLWAALDALAHAYLENNIPPGAFVPNRWEWA
jgi:pyrroloquinoline-quinone synthase